MVNPLSAEVFVSTGPIDLKIEGDVPALYDLSRDMSTIYDRLDDVVSRLGLLPENISFFW